MKGDAIKGEILLKSVGCTGCHKLTETPLSAFQDPSPEKKATRSRFLEEFAPTLFGVGSKMNKAWLYAWVRNPKKHFKDSNMPNLRLSEQEATDVVEYLMTLKKPDWEKVAAPLANPDVINDLILEILRKVMSDHDAAETVAGKNTLRDFKDMATADGKVKWLGRKMVKNFGCYSCHQLKDDPDTGMKWQDEEGVGVELSGSQPWGSKHHDKLDFGFTADDGVNHHGVKAVHPYTGDPVEAHVAESRAAWLENKLHNPRVFDAGKMSSSRGRAPPHAELRLERDGDRAGGDLRPVLRGPPVTGLVENAKKRPNAEEMATYRGDRIARDNNCRACHRLSVDKLVIEWVRKEKGKEKKTPVEVEGRFGRIEPADSTETNLRRWKDPADREKKPLLGANEDLKKSGKRLETYSWTSDHSTLGAPGITPETSLDPGEAPVVSPDSKYIYFDGYERWYLDVQGGEIKHKRRVLRHAPRTAGDIIPSSGSSSGT